MINRKNVLGKVPEEVGIKDAVHTAIVSVRAAKLIEPGQRCKLNEFNEAVPDNKGIGLADPWRKSNITRGQVFWLVLNQEEVPNVQHTWEHPTVNFEKPTRDVVRNSTLLEYSTNLGMDYDDFLDVLRKVVDTDSPVKYTGSKTEEEVEAVMEDMWDLWSEFTEETGYEFENMGTNCCPEYEYPHTIFFFN